MTGTKLADNQQKQERETRPESYRAQTGRIGTKPPSLSLRELRTVQAIYYQSCDKRITKLRSARENFFGSPFSADKYQRNSLQASQEFSWKQ